MAQKKETHYQINRKKCQQLIFATLGRRNTSGLRQQIRDFLQSHTPNLCLHRSCGKEIQERLLYVNH